ncbi:hypothetical protein [Adhaeretor mobilis]|uniref:Uncharacterized protein n=1 Tax=Adhaeretor mobilis TaxID=1930276 RepID=A0A517N219_9BACT|nr:hypothetical protein [Adhaeretor mobilis]QDT01189.1 hypothetical protein HG15A2_45310 [Adhaeretor mobilis]
MSALLQPELPLIETESEDSAAVDLALEERLAGFEVITTAGEAPATVIRTTVLGVIGAMIFAGTVLTLCRLFGEATADMPRGTLFGIALLGTVAVKFGRVAWRRQFGTPRTKRARRLDQLVGWGSSLGLILLAVGCCYPAYRNSDWLIWLPMLIADQFWRQTFFDNDRPNVMLADLPSEEELAKIKQISEKTEEIIDSEETRLGEEVLQQLFRVRDEQGYEVIYGTVRAGFVTGQRHATVHVGFCPPLAATPSVEAEACDFEEAKVKVAQAMAHGVRLDVRLSEPAEEACSVTIDLAATPNSLSRS